jgi:hypothetical protein
MTLSLTTFQPLRSLGLSKDAMVWERRESETSEIKSRVNVGMMIGFILVEGMPKLPAALLVRWEMTLI